MKQSHISLIVVFLLSLGCETVVDITIPVEDPQLVINSTLIDDDFIKVNLTESHHILKSGKYQGVLGATVNIYENDELLTTLPDSSEGNYISAQFKAQKGKNILWKWLKLAITQQWQALFCHLILQGY